MNPERRTFLRNASASLAVGMGATMANAQEPADKPVDDHAILDFGMSFVCNQASFNSVQFWIERRTTVIDQRQETVAQYYQCGSCKSENTFAQQDLFAQDNYDFLPILGGSTWLIFRRPCRISDNYRQVVEKLWGEAELKLRYAKRARVLEGFEAVRSASAAGLPIVAQTEIWNEQTKLRAIIEYPVKTMNVSLDKSMYQVDTGPVALPDLDRRYEPPIDALRLAFVAFNAANFADFVVEQPTPVVESGRQLAQVYHYSNPFSLPAKNRLYAVELPI